MITKTVGFKVGDKFFATIEDAQLDAIVGLFSGGAAEWPIGDIAEHIVAERNTIIDILTTSAKSRPAARSVNGGKKPRKAKSVVQSVSGSQGAQVSSGEKIEQAK